MATLGGTGGSSVFSNFAALQNNGFSKFASVTTLVGRTTVGGSAYYATLRKLGDTFGYQVPNGKKLVLMGALITAAAGTDIAIGHGDTDVGMLSSTTPTNFTQNYFDITTVATGQQMSFVAIVPAGRYPFMTAALSSANGYGYWYGYEINADATSI